MATELTSEEVSKFAYLFADHLPHASEEKIGAIELLLQLETACVLSPNRPKLLTNMLNAIILAGRKDLATAFLSVQTPQSIQSSFSASHQLLHVKMSMLMYVFPATETAFRNTGERQSGVCSSDPCPLPVLSMTLHWFLMS